jgi:hypothetical protein
MQVYFKPDSTQHNLPISNIEEITTAIEKAILNVANNGGKPSYQERIRLDLTRIATHTDIFDTAKVSHFIANGKVTNPNTKKVTDKNWSDGYKIRLADSYKIFSEVHNLGYKKQKFSYKSPIPLIPKTDYIEAIVANSTRQYGVLFRISR